MWRVTTLTVALFCGTACAIAAEPAKSFLGKTQEQWVADLKSELPAQRQLAAWAIAQSPPNPVNPLFDAAHHEDPIVRYWIAARLSQDAETLGPTSDARKSIYNIFVRLLEDTSPAVRLTAAEGLAKTFPYPDAFAVLVEALSDPQEAVRIQAICSLERLGPKAAPLKEHIAKATANDTSEYVKRISTRLLARLAATPAP